MQKPKYSKEEIRVLFDNLGLIDNDYPDIQTVRSSITQTRLQNLHDHSDLNGDPMIFVRQQVESLINQMQLLQKIVDTFDTTPMKEIPTLINDSNEIVAVIARWRLKRGQ